MSKFALTNLILWLIVMIISILGLIDTIELQIKYKEAKADSEMYKKQCIRLSSDRLEVKRILQNDTTNLAKYY